MSEIVKRRIYHINDQVANIQETQLCFELLEDPDLGFRMWCGKDDEGTVTKWLAKGENALVDELTVLDAAGTAGFVRNDEFGRISGGHAAVTSITDTLSVSGAIVFQGSGVSQSGNTFTFVNTNTTYSAGTGLDLSDTTFSLSHLGLESLSDPGADRLLGWDESANATSWFSLSGLDITETTLRGRLSYLADVSVQSTVPANGNVVAWDSTSARWGLSETITSSAHREGSFPQCLTYLGTDFGDASGGVQCGFEISDAADYAKYSTNFFGTDDTFYGGTGGGWFRLMSGDMSDGSLAYSILHGGTTGVWFVTPHILGSSSWGDNPLQVTGSSDEVGKLYLMGPAVDPEDGTGVGSTRKSIAAAILAAAYLPTGAIAFGDANALQYGDTTRLSFTKVSLVDYLTIGENLKLGDNGLISAAGSSLGFSDQYRSGSTWGSGGIPLSAGADEWSDIETLIGSEGSIFGAILAAADSGGGSLQASYDLGRSIQTSSTSGGAVSVTVPSSYSGSALALTNSATANSAEVINIHNDAVWDEGTTEPYTIWFDGDAGLGEGGAREAGALGHRLWTEDYISVGRTNSAGFMAYFSATEGPVTNPDGRRVHAHLRAYAFDNVADFREREAWIRVEGSGVSGGLSSAFVEIYADDSVGISSGTSVNIGDIHKTLYLETTPSSSSGVHSLNLETTHTFVGVELDENITVTCTGTPGDSRDITIIYRNTDTVARTVGAFTKSSSAFITWVGLNPNASAVTLDVGYVMTVLIRYHKESDVYLGFCDVSAIAEV